MAIIRENQVFKLQNDYIYREIDISQGPTTKAYHIRPEGQQRGEVWYPMFTFTASLPFEAAVTIGGITYEAGPWKESNHWQRGGAFRVNEATIDKGSFGDRLTLACVNLQTSAPAVELVLEYEIADTLPLIIKRMKVVNRSSSETVVVDNMTVENLYLWRDKFEMDVFTDYYWDTRREDEIYRGFTRFEFPEAVAIPLKPGESCDSFTCYETVTSNDRDEKSIQLHRVYKKLAPWITNTYTKQIVNTCKSYEELIEVADRAAECGIETVGFLMHQIWTNIGDYIPRLDLFPNGEADLKRLIQYYHDKGLIILPYCATAIAWNENCTPMENFKWVDSQVAVDHPEWQYLGPEGMRYAPEAFGNMCYQSGWGDYIRNKLLYLIEELGFDGMDLDGPYHGLPCLDDTHKHGRHASVRYMNWAWEKQFFGEVAARGKIITAPQEWQSIFLGVGQRPGGYREEEYAFMGGMPLIVQGRSFLYDARYDTPACMGWAFTSLGIYHKNSIEANDDNPITYEHAIATMFGYGHAGILFGQELYVGERTKAILQKWTRFYKTYRETMKGELVHIARPNHADPDAVMHVNPEADVPALLVVFNPTGERKEVSFELPLNYAGFKAGEEAVLDDATSLKLDSRAHACLTLTLEPFEILTIPLQRLPIGSERAHA
ncbi:MAG: hypothetical protein J7639_32885, partial [Paenibacillaceae bacterium]|nr:hypothetical protein [Paenibacillaceae bacterium]